MKTQTREEPKIVAAAERQMHAWSLTQQIAERIIRVDYGHADERPLGKYVTISREAGAGGGHIADLIGAELCWEVLDKGLLDRVADRYQLSRPMLELVDETQSNWAFDMLGPWLDPGIIPHEKYFVHLSRVILAAARQGNVVLVGRGAQFLLPSDQGLAVRIVASEKYRIKNLSERLGIGAAAARRMMHELDRGRRDFVHHFFRRDVADHHLYDLVVNAERLGPAGAARRIVSAYREP